MRENRLYGSEGGEDIKPSLPLSICKIQSEAVYTPSTSVFRKRYAVCRRGIYKMSLFLYCFHTLIIKLLFGKLRWKQYISANYLAESDLPKTCQIKGFLTLLNNLPNKEDIIPIPQSA